MSDQNSDPSRPFDPPVPPTAPPAPPQAPPAPPAAPEPQRPEVPQYGEYAPVDTTNPYGVPGYPAASAPVPPAVPVAPGAPTYGAPTYGAPAYAPPVRKRRTWDVVLTCILLVLGFFGMSLGLFYAWAFSNPEVLSGALAQQGLTGQLEPGAAPAVITISHIVLYLLALGLSIPLLVRGKTVVFWIPLVIGVVAAIIFWVGFGIVVASDTALLNSYTGS